MDQRFEHPLAQAMGSLAVSTRPRGFHDITQPLARWLAERGAADGLLTLFIRHTSASLLIQENADPDVQRDLKDALARLAPASESYRHSLEGSDDMPAHIKSTLTATNLAIPVRDGRLRLGTWQAVYVVEHRNQAYRREIELHFSGSFEA
ncbi:MAG: secondary thiamine-phosphate synthase enzyme YjbQ [Parvibaculaceae bacterium]